MSEILALQMRPKSLSALVGQKTVAAAVAHQMQTRPPKAIMLYGPSGCGKTTLARIIALSAQCTHQGTEWGKPCDTCWSQYGTFSILEVNASETNGVEDLGKIAELARYHPMPPSQRTVIILDEAQMMSNNAQNLLLKPFEDAPSYMLWIICTTAPTKILPTLRRRCVTYHMTALSFDDRKRLVLRAAKRINLTRPTAPLIEAISEQHVSSPALVLMAVEKYAAGESPQAAASGADTPSVNSLAVCRAMASGSWTGLRAALENATAEEARYIRASAVGYLRGMLVKESSAAQRRLLAENILALTAPAPLEDALLLNWLWAVLCQITQAHAKKHLQK